MGTVTESIFSGINVVVPMADVQHIELHKTGIMVVTKHSKWNFEHDVWKNGLWMNEPDAQNFRRAWCDYRSELEAETLADLRPDAGEFMKLHDRTIDALKSA